MCLGKNSAQAANVRAQRVRCSGLHIFEKLLAFLREAVDFVDSLTFPLSGGRFSGPSLPPPFVRNVPFPIVFFRRK